MSNSINKSHFLAVPTIGALLLALTSAAPAVTLVTPIGFGGTEGNTSSRAPLHRDALREQNLYGSSLFPAGLPLSITEIRYRRDSTFNASHSDTYTETFNAGDIEIWLSTTAVADDALSTTFANNIGANELLVHDGPLTINSTDTSSLSPKPFDIIISLETPFVYDPSQGNLLVDFKISTALPISGVEHDVVDAPGDGLSRVLFIGAFGDTSDPNAPVANLAQSVGPVTEFVFDVIPEPSTTLLAVPALAVLALRRRRQGSKQ